MFCAAEDEELRSVPEYTKGEVKSGATYSDSRGFIVLIFSRYESLVGAAN
jgi:hypothetical protein